MPLENFIGIWVDGLSLYKKSGLELNIFIPLNEETKPQPQYALVANQPNNAPSFGCKLPLDAW